MCNFGRLEFYLVTVGFVDYYISKMNEYYSLTKAVNGVIVFVSSERRDTYAANH